MTSSHGMRISRLYITAFQCMFCWLIAARTLFYARKTTHSDAKRTSHLMWTRHPSVRVKFTSTKASVRHKMKSCRVEWPRVYLPTRFGLGQLAGAFWVARCWSCCCSCCCCCCCCCCCTSCWCCWARARLACWSCWIWAA